MQQPEVDEELEVVVELPLLLLELQPATEVAVDNAEDDKHP